MKEGDKKSESKNEMGCNGKRGKRLPFLALKVEGGTMSQGMQEIWVDILVVQILKKLM